MKPTNSSSESESPSSSPHVKPPPSIEPTAPARPKIETTNTEDTIARVAAEDLPSHREKQRWDFSKRITEMMDELLPKLAVVTQKVNTYTGTDYSSIEALRQEIKDQENLVRARRHAIDHAKQALDAAHAQQAAAQKEVVALLERKHSWSATDLERYMSLIRSEHVNDQAVRESKEAVFSAENALEDARTLLEKRERAQYHEEQIWSDTIRRNSTWVTFGLMGVNIFLLLATMLVLEPWRRRRMVREIKNALDAQKTVVDVMPASSTLPPIPPLSLSSLEAAIDKAVEEDLASSPLVDPQSFVPPIPEIELHSSNPEVDPPLLQTRNHEPGVSTHTTSERANAKEEVLPAVSGKAEEIALASTLGTNVEVSKKVAWQERLTTQAKDLVSEQYISIRKRDLTNLVLEGAAAGAVITGVILQILWR